MIHDNHSHIQSCPLSPRTHGLILAELHDGARDLDVLVVQGHEHVSVEWVSLAGHNSVDFLRSLKTGPTFLKQPLLSVCLAQAIKN